MRSRFAAVALALVACLGFCPPALAQMSDAVHHDRVVTGRAGAEPKFLERKALPDAHDDEEATRPRDHCPANLRLRWMTEVSSSVYSTPVVADLFDDGHSEILVPSFVPAWRCSRATTAPRRVRLARVPRLHRARQPLLVHDFGSRPGRVEILLPLYRSSRSVPSTGRRSARMPEATTQPTRPSVPPEPVRRRWYVQPRGSRRLHVHPRSARTTASASSVQERRRGRPRLVLTQRGVVASSALTARQQTTRSGNRRVTRRVLREGRLAPGPRTPRPGRRGTRSPHRE